MKKSFGAKTLVFPTPVWVVGTYDRVAVSLRKATYTYGNIVERRTIPSATRRDTSISRK
jgi:hypothetical protein